MARPLHPYKALLRLGIPIVLGQLGIIVVNFADNIMVGHHLKVELAAASFVNSLFGLAFILGLGFSYGLTPIVSAAIASGRTHESGVMLRQSLQLNLGISILLAIVMTALLIRIDLFGLPQSVLDVMKPYYIIQLICLPLVMTFNAYKQYFDGVRRTDLAMYVILMANILNISANYLLIYGHGGLPELGLTGAGIASLAARLFASLCLIFVFHFGGRWRQVHRAFVSQAQPKHYYRQLISLGIPVATQMGLEATSFTIAVVFVGLIGEDALAAHQIICTITTLGFMIYYGIGAAATIQISYSHAQGARDEVRATVQAAERMAIMIALGLILLLLSVRSFVGYLFTTDQTVVSIVAVALIPVMFYQIGDALQVIYANVLRGLEQVRCLAISATIAHIGIAPLLAYLFAFHIAPSGQAAGLSAVWWAFPISLTILGWTLRRQFYRFLKRSSLPS